MVTFEGKVEDLKGQLAEANEAAFTDGFRSYMTGFLAVDPDYDWAKFVPATRTWIEEFKVEQAQAIEEKRLEIGSEAASASASKFLENASPTKAHQVGEDNHQVEVPRLESGENIPQDIQTDDASRSQAHAIDSSQDQV